METIDNLFDTALEDLALKFEQSAQEIEETPADWLENNFVIPEPWDIETGNILPMGTIRLAPHQRRIINEALSKDERGMLKYSTIIFSAPKKSGKSALSSGVALYTANKHSYSEIFLLANDGKQSEDRLYLPISICLKQHNARKMKLKGSRVNDVEAWLPNNAHIQAVNCDAAGEAGANPTAVFISEIWGYDTSRKRKLFSEMTIPSTRWGRAFRWLETYAGYTGVSDLLEDLYNMGVKEGTPHPEFTDLIDDEGQPVVWVNESARMFVYWDHVPRLVWQQVPEYYAQEAKMLEPAEFLRMHRNMWASPIDVYVRPEWWEACADTELPDLIEGSDVPVVIGIDAAIEGDCAAVVVVTRHPFLPETDVAVRYCRIFKPEYGKPVMIERDVGGEIRKLVKKYNVVCIAYDSFQMEGLVQNYRKGNVTVDQETREMSPEEQIAYIKRESDAVQVWYYKFGQQQPRAVADKRLYDMIQSRQVHWNPNDRNSDIVSDSGRETLTKQIKAAGSKKDGGKLRIEKLSNKAHVDAPVALSMAVQKCMTLNIDNREAMAEDAILAFQRGQITYTQLLEKLKTTREAD